jgi:hypothetical protein
MLSTKLADGGVGVRAMYVTGAKGHLLEVAVVPDNVARAKRALDGDG